MYNIYSPALKKWGLNWICLVLPSFCNFSNENFSSHFSQELWSLEVWNLVHMWTVGSCIVCTGIRCCSYSSLYSFFFLSSFQILRFFVTLFTGTVRPRRLKHGTHVDGGQMYCVYCNQAAAAYLSLYFIFLSLQFSDIQFFVTFFSGTVRPRRLKHGTHVDNGQMYRVYCNQAAAAYLSLYFFIFFLRFSNIKIFCHTFLRNCEA